MPSALFLGSSSPLGWVLHATLIEEECLHSRLDFTANSLHMANASWHTSITPLHGRDCPNSAVVVVGDDAAELRPYIYPREIFTTIS